MRVMLFAFAVALALAAAAGYVLNTEYQITADERFVGSGAQLRPNEAGSNLVGKDWTGLNLPSAGH